MVISGLQKQPNEILKQVVDYSYWLNGSLISSVAVTSLPAGLTLTTAIDATFTKVSLFMAGGEDGVAYDITLTANVGDGQRREDEIKLAVKEIP